MVAPAPWAYFDFHEGTGLPASITGHGGSSGAPPTYASPYAITSEAFLYMWETVDESLPTWTVSFDIKLDTATTGCDLANFSAGFMAITATRQMLWWGGTMPDLYSAASVAPVGTAFRCTVVSRNTGREVWINSTMVASDTSHVAYNTGNSVRAHANATPMPGPMYAVRWWRTDLSAADIPTIPNPTYPSVATAVKYQAQSSTGTLYRVYNSSGTEVELRPFA